MSMTRLAFQQFIENGIQEIAQHENFQEKTIANLSFTRDGQVGGELKIVLDGFFTPQPGTQRVYPTLKFFIGQNSTYKLNAQWALTSPAGQNNIKFWFRDVGAYWIFLRPPEDQDQITDGGNGDISGFSPCKELPRVNAIDDYFVRFWFPPANTDGPTGQAPNIQRTDDWCDQVFKEDWERIKFDGRVFRIAKFPDFPDSEEKFMDQEMQRQWAKFIIVLLCWRFILVHCSGKNVDRLMELFSINEQDGLERFYSHLPDPKDYIPTRPVDINAHELYIKIEEQGLKIPWHVVASAATALNAEKHIIFTGPPGCGKTEIAAIIGRHASNQAPLMVTASQAWTTDEIIGRYMPTLDGQGLTFKEGFFLQALDEKRWLIIDEINRCDIDNCFGELFTVLSGHSVTLPFEKAVESNDEQKDVLASVPIRIVVGQNNEGAMQEGLYRYFDRFRLLATMNDADIAGLNQLSYALRRRFAIIRVDAPNRSKRKEIFEERRDEVYDQLQLDDRVYTIKVGQRNTTQIDFKAIISILEELFAKGNDSDLIDDLRIVGIAPVLDIIRFVGEGLRSSDPNDENRRITVEDGDQNIIKKELLHSFLAMGLVLNVFPQLDAVTGETVRFKKALICIHDAFGGETENFWYIERDENDKLNLKAKSTIRQYLFEKLKRQYATDTPTLTLIEKVFNSIENTASQNG